MEEADVVIIGAGVYGITNASTYHRLHPEAKILIVDSANSVGGPWAPDRVFPGLKTNNLWGMYEHPEFPMDLERFGVKAGEHIPAEKMLEYLRALAEWADITQFLKLNTAVESIEQVGQGWKLNCVSVTGESKPIEIKTPKLIIAMGITHKPYMPRYSASQEFESLIIHSKDFPAHFNEIVQPDRHTVIVGSGKSAWDVAYACAKQPNSTATILIRPSGNGPVWMAPSHVTPLTLWLEKLIFTRFFGFMSPCPWAETRGIEGWLRYFFQNTWLGRKATSGFWYVLGEDAISLMKLDAHPETKKLRPWRGAFEVGNALSIHNYPTSFFDLVREGRIKIVFDEISSFENTDDVRLKSGTTLTAQAIVYATGWISENTLPFTNVSAPLGLPSTAPLSPSEQSLISQTEQSLLAQFPYLRTRDTSRTHHIDPAQRHTQRVDTAQQPYRLHRFIVPPALLESRSLAFAGALMCLGTTTCAYLQSLWITKYLDGSLALPAASPEQIRADTYRDSQYCAIRGAMSHGRVLPDVVFDSLSYFDVLCRDLGVEGKRKGWGFGEVVKSYGPQDYRGVLE
ncbi:FAD/NAD(P)-binding domain-containing protein, partial [Pyrenochaeta sp. DS3sAY3a]